ncbi:MAG: response regulator [Cyclobacteriaceae bacterium]|nr:response regulator [Cyclobacteriaceae bacterium]
MNTILVIEDNQEMAENISAILQLGKYAVLTAPNGKAGVEAAQQMHPDLVLCDIMMPELDGYGVLHLLNKDPETANIPFVFLTAKADKSDFRAGMNLGADDYVTKPFDGFDLLKVVEMRLKKNAMMKATYENNIDGINNFFSHAKELQEFKKLSESRPVRNCKKKEFLFMEGQNLNDLYFVNSGKVKTYKSNGEGKELITGIHGAGSYLGYVSLVEGSASHETAIVLEDAEIAFIPKQDFLSLLYSNKEVAQKFIKLLSNNLAEAEGRLLDIAYQSVRQRVAGTLLKLSGKADLVTVVRRDISSLVATATESLNRTLADFKDEGLIDLLPDGIRILNAAKLEKVVRL